MAGMHQSFDLGKIFQMGETKDDPGPKETTNESAADAADEAVDGAAKMLEHLKGMARQMRQGENRLAVGSYVRAIENFSRSMQMAGEMLQEAFLDTEDDDSEGSDPASAIASALGGIPGVQIIKG